MGGIGTDTIWLTAFRGKARERMLLFYKTSYCVLARKNTLIKKTPVSRSGGNLALIRATTFLIATYVITEPKYFLGEP